MVLLIPILLATSGGLCLRGTFPCARTLPTTSELSANVGMRHSAQEEQQTQNRRQQLRGKTLRPDHCSRGNGTESGRFGDIELVDVGDGTPDFTEFVACSKPERPMSTTNAAFS